MKYQKIPNLFQLNVKSKPVRYLKSLYDNEYLTYVFTLHSVVWYAEKFDGTNIRVCWDGYNITFKGREDNSDIPSHLLSALTEMFVDKDTVFERLFGEKQVILFGEGIGHKIQSSKLQDNKFVLFDIAVNGSYIARVEALQDIAKEFDIPIVEYKMASVMEVLDECLQRKGTKSEIVQNAFEGYVIRPAMALYDNQGHRIAAKLKCKYM